MLETVVCNFKMLPRAHVDKNKVAKELLAPPFAGQEY